MNDRLVTIAMPSYNSMGTIGPCLSSLESQTFARDAYEIIVGDNGSTDGTQDYIAREFPRVRIVPAPQRGSGFARNAAITAARGRYILSIDDDCTADPDWVRTMTRALEDRPGIAAFGGAIRPFAQRTFVERYRRTWIQQKNLADGVGPFRYAETPNAGFRREIFTQLGGFDGSVMDDVDLGVRMAKANMQIAYLPDAIVFHRNPATLRRLYRQRFFYGQNEPALGDKHPELWPPIRTAADVRARRIGTMRRLVRDLVQLPGSLLLNRNGEAGTRLAPVVDMVVAVAYQRGLERGFREYRGTRP